MPANPTTETLEIQSDNLQKAALIYRAINHKLRQQILCLLHTKGKMSVTDIFVKLHLDQTACSQHLSILRKAKLVQAERDGKQIHYSVNYGRVRQLHDIADQLL